MYTMLNNRQSSKFDLYLPGRLVASLHYKIDDEANEVMVVYCESIERIDAEDHCRELMKRAMEELHNRRLAINVVCPIALKHLNASKPSADTA